MDEEINKSTLLMFLPWFRLSPIGYYSQNTRCLYLHAAHIKILLFMKFQGQQGKGWILCVVLIVRSCSATHYIDPVLASCKKNYYKIQNHCFNLLFSTARTRNESNKDSPNKYEREIDKTVCSQTEPAAQNAAKQKIFSFWIFPKNMMFSL